MKVRCLVLRVLVAGLTATMTMDLCGALGRRLGVLRGVDVAHLAKWFGLVLRGDFVHEDIGTAPERAVPLGVALAIHHLIGVGLAAVHIALFARANRRVSATVAVAFGLATSALPWFVMFPAMGYGLFGLDGPADARLFRTSSINHVAYGVGLAIAARVWPALAAAVARRLPAWCSRPVAEDEHPSRVSGGVELPSRRVRADV